MPAKTYGSSSLKYYSNYPPHIRHDGTTGPLLTFLLISLYKLTTPCVAQETFPTTDRDITAVDNCFSNLPFSIQGECNIINLEPIGDDRYFVKGHRQCRVRCHKYSNPDFRITHVPTNCTICSDPAAKQFGTAWYLDVTYVQLCIPRGTCIANCGAERPGCVYTGSCGSQICVESTKSNKPALTKRATHAGPGSVFAVTKNGVQSSTPTGGPVRLPGSNRIKFSCNDTMGFSQGTNQCSEDGKTPLGDGRGDWGQCRAVCLSFDPREYEVIRYGGRCGFCARLEAAEFISFTYGKRGICIPLSRCVAECGAAKPGCIYTGSCRAQICFSGIFSKRPAVISFDSNGRASISVNNTGAPISIDPPLFSNGALAPPKSPPGATTAPPTKIPTSEAPPINPEKSNNTLPTSSIENGDDRQRKEGPWVWLGPTLGFFGALMAALATVGAACVLRKRSRFVSEIGEVCQYDVPLPGADAT